MPPKPWEKKGVAPAHNISEIIQSNPTVKEEVPKVGMDGMPDPNSRPIANSNDPLASANSMNSSLGGYGGMGGMGSSMYGGYGGMGGMGSYGMGMGGMYGGMGGYGMMGMGMGMGMGMDQNSTLFNSMIALQSFGFLINSLSDIARSLDQNYEGLQLFKSSCKSFTSKIESGVKDSIVGAGQSTKKAAFSIIGFIKDYILCMGQQDQKNKLRAVKLIMAAAVFIFILSFYPLLRKLKR